MTKKTKKNVKFREKVAEGVDENTEFHSKKTHSESSKSRRFKEKHSLDSDEELDEEDIDDGPKNVLHEDDIEGEEDETIRNDDGITVTPFNLKDELEEGYFDAQGNYIANKDTDVTDQWLESVDWKKVEDRPFRKKVNEKKEDEDEPVLEPLKIMQDMIGIMKPGENVLKCLRRLGGNKKPVSSADRWKKKKQKVEDEPIDEKAVKDKEDLLKLTGLADSLLQGGDFQIYEKTYEQMSHEVKGKLSQFQDADEDDDDDDDDELEAAFKKPKLDLRPKGESDDELESTFNKPKSKVSHGKSKVSKNGAKMIGGASNETITSLSDEVSWIYKLDDNDDSEHIGPFTSTEMLKMQEDGKFGSGVLCRKVGTEGSYYNSKRIDFDLYI